MSPHHCLVLLLACFLATSAAVAQSTASRPFLIKVIDDATQRGVPLVELETVHGMRWITDNAGFVSINEADLEGKTVFFHIKSHGYSYPEDGFGYSGKRLDVVRGQSAIIKIKRTNLAERLYRITGAGRYLPQPLTGEDPLFPPGDLPGGVVGSDSVYNAIYQGKLFWVWGDTNRHRYPLGNFHASAAWSDLTDQGGMSPDRGVRLRYITGDDGFVKGVARMPGDGPTWLSALVTLPDRDGTERLCASYVKVRGFLDVYERGLCVFDPAKEAFEQLHVFPDLDGRFPDGHATVWQGRVYFGQATPTLAVDATFEAWADPIQYADIKPEVAFVDAADGKAVKAHHGHFTWNPYRKRWVSIFTKNGGPFGPLSDVYYAEAQSLEGPWKNAVKIITHDNYTFYNPAQHPWFAQDDEPVLYLEGTFSKMFSKTQVGVPRYDYNQIMYRLDLEHPALDIFDE